MHKKFALFTANQEKWIIFIERLVDMLQVNFECRNYSVQAYRLYFDRFQHRNALNRRKLGRVLTNNWIFNKIERKF